MNRASLLPASIAGRLRPIQPGQNLAAVAAHIVDRAWRSRGVRVYRWPCGALAVVVRGGREDAVLLRECPGNLWATYARHGVPRAGQLQQGPTLQHVLADLRAANRCAP